MKFAQKACILLVSVLFVYVQGLSKLQNKSGHDIIEGNCSNLPYNERVYYDHVDKAAFPLIIRSEQVDYHGDGVIYCILAMNQKNNETGGTSKITDGGVGHTFVAIDLESYRGHGLEYYVSIFAKNSTNASSIAGVKPPMAQRILNNN